MKNPFKRLRAKEAQTIEPAPPEEVSEPIPAEEPAEATAPIEEPPEDPFTEWCRTQIRGGIERRERNDIFEAYTVFGMDEKGDLAIRYYHRYPEHEREFDLSYTRALSFCDFNRRLLSELDKGDLKLPEYNTCIKNAAEISGEASGGMEYVDFSDDEIAALQEFCDGVDTLKDKGYLHSDGVFCCECESVVGGESLNIRFRKPLPYDALSSDIAGVSKESVAGYDIADMWILGVYNRLRERCASCEVTQLTSEWSLEKESVLLIACEGFDDVNGTVYAAVAASSAFRRFGFYSLDFSKK